MANYTANYGLYKPNRLDNDPVDTTLSTNFDIIDTEIKNRKNENTQTQATVSSLQTQVQTLAQQVANGGGTGGGSQPSGPDTTAPNDVTNLVVSNLSTTSLTLTWTPSSSSDVASYDVYRGTSLITTVMNNTTDITGLTPSTNYTFWIKAKDVSGNVANGTSINIITNAVVDTTPPIVTASVLGGNYSSAQTVTLTSNEQATIYYTTDGSLPTTSSTVYSTPIFISATTTLKFFGKDSSNNSSGVQSVTYTITVVDTTPPVITASPTGGNFTGTQNVTLTSNENAVIYYTTDSTTPQLNTINLPKVDKVVLLILENHALSQIQGNASAPYLNSLMSQGANFTHMKALTHPSQPNYYNLFAGSTIGISDNTYKSPQYSTPNVYTLLSAGNYSFAGYFQSMPSNGYTGSDVGYYPYADRHNPVKSFTNVPGSSNLTFSSFPSSNFSLLPTVSYVVPDDMSNMHDGTVAQCDSWVQTNIDPYVQWAKANNSLLIMTFDEDDTSGDNTIPTCMVGPMVKTGTITTAYTHFDLIRTVLDLYGVGYVGSYATATPITDAWKTPLTSYAPKTGTYLYQKPIPISSTTTIKYFGRDTAGNNSTVASQIYTSQVTDTTPPTVTISPTPTTYSSNITVSMTASEPSTIYYTTDGTTPTTSSNVWTGNTFVTYSTTFKYFAKDTAGNSSAIQTASYIINNVVDTTPPNEVTNLSVSSTGSTNITLSWTASTSSDIAGYEIYRGTTFVGSTTTAVTYNVTGLTASTNYTFVVKAKDATGNLSSGVSINATTAASGPVMIASDSFNRTNNTTSMGSTDSTYGGTAKTWSTLTNDGAVYGINANQAYLVTQGSVPNKSAAVIDVGVNDYSIEVKLSAVGTAEYPKLLGRVQDFQNYVYLAMSPSDSIMECGYYTNGVGTVLAGLSGTYNNGDVIKLVVSGNTMTPYRNGVAWNTPLTIPSFLLTSSKVGLNAYKYPNSRFDDFKVTT